MRKHPRSLNVTDLDGIRCRRGRRYHRSNADRLHAILEDAAAGRTEFILSLQCDFCDSYGLAMIIALSRQIGTGCIITANDRVRRIIDIAGLGKVLRLSPTVADAVDALLSP